MRLSHSKNASGSLHWRVHSSKPYVWRANLVSRADGSQPMTSSPCRRNASISLPSAAPNTKTGPEAACNRGLYERTISSQFCILALPASTGCGKTSRPSASGSYNSISGNAEPTQSCQSGLNDEEQLEPSETFGSWIRILEAFIDSFRLYSLLEFHLFNLPNLAASGVESRGSVAF